MLVVVVGEQEQSAICWWVHLEFIVKLKSIELSLSNTQSKLTDITILGATQPNGGFYMTQSRPTFSANAQVFKLLLSTITFTNLRT